MKIRILQAIIAICVFSAVCLAQTLQTNSPLDSVVTVYTVVDGKDSSVGSGVVVGADGLILTPLHLVKNASQVSIKLRNGEVYDNAKITKRDERRNVALLQIIAGDLRPITYKATAESIIGSSIAVISNFSGTAPVAKDATLTGIQMADGIYGAGSGYRVILFDVRASEDVVGGLLLNDTGSPIGIVTTNANVKQGNIAVPFSSISGLFPATISDMDAFKTGNQESRKLDETKSGGAKKSPVKPEWSKAHQVLHSAQTIYVHSKTSFIQDPAFIAELMKNPDFTEWGWSFTNDRETADLVLEVERLPWVIKFAFKVYSIKHGVIIASGNVHTNDFNYGSPDMVREVIRRIKIEMAMAK